MSADIFDYRQGYDDALHDVRDILSANGHTEAALAINLAIKIGQLEQSREDVDERL